MKILTVNLHNDVYGAGRAAYRLHQGLLQHTSCEASMLVGIRQQPDATVTEIFKGQRRKLRYQLGVQWEQWPLRRYKPNPAYFFSPGGSLGHGVVEQIRKQNPDLVHLHWINHGFISLNQLLGLNVPMVISFHDMWYMTGGCHYDEGCGRFVSGCGKCPALRSTGQHDLSERQYRMRRDLFAKMPQVTVVGLSRWMHQSALSSQLWPAEKVVHLPNGIDTNFFKPLNRQLARNILNLPQDELLVLFGAVDPLSDPRKGYPHLKSALEQVRSEATLLVFGGERNPNQSSMHSRFKEIHFGQVKDEATLVLLYSAADVTVLPSRQENLPNVVMESMACGTPVVAFKTGGNGDLILHGQNGLLAPCYDSGQLAAHLDRLLGNTELRTQYGQHAVKHIHHCFALDGVARQYETLYRNILSGQW